MFGGATQAVRRFSLLLLEEGELYLEDFVATARWPAGVAGNWQRLPRLPGQLRLCTKSLFFEPDDVRVPIVRLPFQHVEGLEGAGDRRLVVAATRLAKMRANAADAPYAVEKAVPHSPARGGGGGHHQPHQIHHQQQQPQEAEQQQGPPAFHWEFELSYATLEGVMPLAQQMMVASRLPPVEQEEFLRATMEAAEAGQRFDIGALRAPSERILLELPCTLLSQGALVREPGRLLLTDQRLYFQPLHPIGGDPAVSSHPLAAVAAAARRRSSLRDLALEVFFAEPSALEPHSEQLAAAPFWGAGASALFSFASREEREQAVGALAAQPALGCALRGGRGSAAACSAILEADPSWLSRVTAAWQRGQVSNLDYLLFLNLASGRSFSDLSQYPVVPWVLADYASPALDLSDPATFRDLSKPVGALNPRRLDMLRERFREMAGFSPEPPFLYGSHYSTPGFTMFWLVRAAPAHMLRLQNGRFDAPDRLFCSVREAWEGVTSTNPADVKELTPEFFLRDDFLLNQRNLALGTRQNGRPVGDVELPPWAGGSAARFLALHRAALEAPFASANLHHWIDLIFGYKQQGPAAVAADNVFRHTAYEGAVDIDAVTDRTERLALETQIQEFGQCPIQLFKSKHPQRLVCPPPEVPAEADAAAAAAAASSEVSHALSLVATILAATERGQGESPRLEVSPLLAQLDVLAGRRQEAAAEAAAEQGSAAGPPSGEAAGEPQAAQQEQQGLSGASSRLLTWAAERKQAVGERLAGSVGAVRGAAAAALAGAAGNSSSSSLAESGSVPRSGNSASRLQALFNRKGSASGSSADVAAAAAEAAAAVPASTTRASPPAAAQPPSPAGRVAAGLVGSIGERLAALRGQQSSPSAATAQQQQQQEQQQPAGSAAEASAAPVAAPALWKFSRPRYPGGSGAAAAIADSSDEEEAAPMAAPTITRHPEQAEATGAGPAASPRSSAAALLEAQRQRMLRQGLGDGGPSAGGPGSSSASSRRGTGWYGAGLRDRLAPTRVLVAGSESVNGCALASGRHGETHLYSASHSGALRVHSITTGEQVRASSLSEQPLTSVALLPLPSAPGGGISGDVRQPLALCGSFDACVHAYSADTGRQLGSWQAAGDAVSCVLVTGSSSGSGSSSGAGGPGSSCRLVTGSWDGSVKLWEVGDGRQPWTASFSQPATSIAAPSGVWAVAVSPEGQLVLAGTEDGLVACWDLRQALLRPLWQRQLAQDDYVGGLELCPDGASAVVAAADGSLSLLELRQSGEVAACVSPSGMPLRCVATDGLLAVAGDEGGGLHMWDVAAQLGAAAPRPPGVWTPPQPDGLFPPLRAEPASAVNALAVAPSPGHAAAGVTLVTAHEGGLLRCYSTSAAAP